MAIYRSPPEPEICLKCGGKIPYKNMNEPIQGARHHCHCPNCTIIGPGPEPLWLPDRKNHVCQVPIDEEAIAEAKAKFEKKWPELTKAIQQIAKKNKTK